MYNGVSLLEVRDFRAGVDLLERGDVLVEMEEGEELVRPVNLSSPEEPQQVGVRQYRDRSLRSR